MCKMFEKDFVSAETLTLSTMSFNRLSKATYIS